ncbi:MAG: hypothetical protein HY000_10580 [Planctomycetes bacterium]|nr:hypothetical protein [Planctomycetota bacterium]
MTPIAPGGTSTFVVRLTAAYEGTMNATITFTTDDADEETVSLNVTANILPYRIIDDQNAADGYAEIEMAEAASGISYRGGVSFASSSLVTGTTASATWTFSNMSPGIYYMALTWFDTSGSPEFYSSNTPVTVLDGAAVEGSFSVNQKIAPNSFSFDGANWLILGFFDFSDPTVTVTMTNLNTDGVTLADGVLVNRVGGGIPAGNGQSGGVAGGSEPDRSVSPSGSALRVTEFSAFDQALRESAFWNDDLEDVTALLADDLERKSDKSFAELVAAGRVDDLDSVDADLIDWLD